MEILTDENINPAFKRVKYGIRGWLEDRTHEIRQELARVSVTVTIKKFRGGGGTSISLWLCRSAHHTFYGLKIHISVPLRGLIFKIGTKEPPFIL